MPRDVRGSAGELDRAPDNQHGRHGDHRRIRESEQGLTRRHQAGGEAGKQSEQRHQIVANLLGHKQDKRRNKNQGAEGRVGHTPP